MACLAGVQHEQHHCHCVTTTTWNTPRIVTGQTDYRQTKLTLGGPPVGRGLGLAPPPPPSSALGNASGPTPAVGLETCSRNGALLKNVTFFVSENYRGSRQRQ